MKVPESCFKWSRGFFIVWRKKKKKSLIAIILEKMKFLRNIELGLGDDAGNWSTGFLSIMKPVCSCDFWFRVLHHQLPLYSDGTGTHSWKDLFHVGHASTRKVVESQKGAQFKNKLESSSSMDLGLFLSIPVTHIMWLCLSLLTSKTRQWYLPVT